MGQTLPHGPPWGEPLTLHSLWGSQGAGGSLLSPPPHTHKDRSGPFLLRQPGLNAGVVPPDPWESGLEQLNFVLSLNPWIGGVVPCWGGGRLPPTLDVPPPHGAEHPKSLTGIFGGFSSPVPPISLPENFVSVWGGALAAVPLVAYLHPVGLIVANYTIMVVKRSRNCWGGVKCFWGAGTRVGRSGGCNPSIFLPDRWFGGLGSRGAWV